MAFTDWITRLLFDRSRRRSRRRPGRHPAPEKQPPSSPATAREQPTAEPQRPSLPPARRPTQPPLSNRPSPSSKPTPITALLVIDFLDENDHRVLPPEVLSGPLGEPVHFRFPEFPDATITAIHGYTQQFVSRYAVMTVRVLPNWAAPVTVYHVDIDSGRLLLPPTILKGRLGAAYAADAEKIANYNRFRRQGAPTGVFDHHPKMIVWYYRQANWQLVQRVTQYVLLTSDQPVRQAPAGSQLGYEFPANSIWRVYLIVTMTGGQQWYNLGADQWLSSTATHLQDHPYQPAVTAPAHPSWTVTPMTATATVSFVPTRPVTYYEAPYGAVAGQVRDGTQVIVKARIIDDQALSWYQIGESAYINGRYLTF